ncbi:MAG: squalene synthase HpnC [Ignavibacteriales bacterium]|nr:squalene synthase HpnC [Ignavibacteriales bacterium]
MDDSRIETGYKAALKLARSHYENFPVISLFVPKELQKEIAVIYWFARTADDIADEGESPPAKRIEDLDLFLDRFNKALLGDYKSEIDAALHSTIISRKLEPQLFRDLISAFRQDISVTRYDEFGEILDYCSRSANPVGRLILQLYGYRNEDLYKLSDKICTSLQLINFYQDISIDFKRNRLYIPIREILSSGLTSDQVMEQPDVEGMRELIKSQVDRAVQIMNEGASLPGELNLRLKLQISATIQGGLKIAQKIAESGYTCHIRRPVLSKKDYFIILTKSLSNVFTTSQRDIKKEQ